MAGGPLIVPRVGGPAFEAAIGLNSFGAASLPHITGTQVNKGDTITLPGKFRIGIVIRNVGDRMGRIRVRVKAWTLLKRCHVACLFFCCAWANDTWEYWLGDWQEKEIMPGQQWTFAFCAQKQWHSEHPWHDGSGVGNMKLWADIWQNGAYQPIAKGETLFNYNPQNQVVHPLSCPIPIVGQQ